MVITHIRFKKRISVVTLFFVCITASAQWPKIKHIEVTAQNQFERELSLKFPVFRFTKATVSNRINQQLQTDFKKELTDDPNVPFDSALIQAINDYSFDFDYELHKHKTLFGITFFMEGSGSYVSYWQKHYFFERSTGALLTLDSLIDPGKSQQFKERILEKQRVLINAWFGEVQNMIDSGWQEKEDLEYIKEVAKNDCMENFHPRHFVIRGDSLEIIIECSVPKVMQNLTFIDRVVLTKNELVPYLKPKYRYVF